MEITRIIEADPEGTETLQDQLTRQAGEMLNEGVPQDEVDQAIAQEQARIDSSY